MTAATDVFVDGPIRLDWLDPQVAGLDLLVKNGLAVRSFDTADNMTYIYQAALAAETAVDPPETPIKLQIPETASRPSTGQIEPSNPSSVETRPAASQSEHRKALWMSKKLKKKSDGLHNDPMALLAALAVHNLIGVSQGVQFGTRPEQISANRIADETGMSRRKAQEAITRAVELGYFKRVDNYKGGRNGAGSAAYLPTVPTLGIS